MGTSHHLSIRGEAWPLAASVWMTGKVGPFLHP
jgi:hypothetical protein